MNDNDEIEATFEPSVQQPTLIDLSGGDIAMLLERWARVADFGRQLEIEAKRRLSTDAGAVPGYCLKPGRKLSEITQPEVVYARVAALGVNQAGFMAAVKIGKEKLENALKGATGLKGKALAQQLAEVLSGCTTEKQAAPSLAKSAE